MTAKFTEAAVTALAVHLAEEAGYHHINEATLEDYKRQARKLLGVVASHVESEPKESETMLTVRIPSATKRKLADLAHERRCTVAVLVRSAVHDFLREALKNVVPPA